MTLLMVLGLAGLAWSQEEPPGSEADEPQLAATEVADEADEIDDSDLDEQTYEEDEDDFVPTEEIPADVPIPFPSNI
jgi:hypothetical protein